MNIVKFLRGVWWGAYPNTLITFYKSYVRSIIDYGSFIYYPTQKTKKDKLDRIQYSAIRMALGERRSTPTNILLDESKLIMLQHRTKILCKNFLLKTFSVRRSITRSIIDKYTVEIATGKRKKQM